MAMKRLGLRSFSLIASLAVAPLSVGAIGCGHSDQEWSDAQRQISELKARLNAAEDRHNKDKQAFDDAQKQLDDLKARMREAGLQYEDRLGRSEKEKADLSQALDEYKKRAAQLDAMKKRLDDLRARLAKLTDAKLKVVVRKNRMVIQLPGDILFRSGEINLEEGGKKVLKQVADIINADDELRKRQFQVAGHTDNVEYGPGIFKDNWGLSLMRARTVLLFLTGKNDAAAGQPAKGGGLDPHNWGAAGYGVMDPIAGTVDKQSDDDKKQNRRVELVLQPNVDEMLNLKDLGDSK
jgi:chemotaxis protein MotB